MINGDMNVKKYIGVFVKTIICGILVHVIKSVIKHIKLNNI